MTPAGLATLARRRMAIPPDPRRALSRNASLLLAQNRKLGMK